MTQIFRRVWLVLAGVALVFAVAQIPAQADTGVLVTREGCTADHSHPVSGRNLRVYMGYSTASGGTNCAWVEKTSNTDVRTFLGIRMNKCVSNAYNGRASCPITEPWAVQDGQFFLYAGPVWKYQTNNRCIWVQIAQGTGNWFNPFPIHHCG